MPIRASNKAEPKYRASNLVRPGLIPEFSRTSPRASPNQASSQDELSLETSRAIPREPNRNQPNRGQNWSETSRNDPRQSCALTHRTRARPSQAKLSLKSSPEFSQPRADPLRHSAVVEQIRVVPSSSRARPKAGTEPRTHSRAELRANFWELQSLFTRRPSNASCYWKILKQWNSN